VLRSMDGLVGSIRGISERLQSLQRVGNQSMETSFNLSCPAGHLMSARITREVFGPICGVAAGKCMRCEAKVDMHKGCYRCNECNISCCMACSRKLATISDVPQASALHGLPGPGDLVLTGPTVSITHVILVVAEMQLNTEYREVLQTPEDHELYACGTVETTPFYPWDCIVEGRLRRSEYFFHRDPCRGRVTLVGMRLWGSCSPPQGIAPLNCKFVFHPFGRTCSSRMDLATFQEAVQASEKVGTYGTFTAIKALMVEHAILDPAKYADAESRAALLLRLRKRWAKARICSSVAIIVWQRYFEMLNASRDIAAADAIVKDILRWMPLKPNKATPSRLVKALTRCRWLLRDDLIVVSTPLDSMSGSEAESERSKTQRGSREASEGDDEQETEASSSSRLSRTGSTSSQDSLQSTLTVGSDLGREVEGADSEMQSGISERCGASI